MFIHNFSLQNVWNSCVFCLLWNKQSYEKKKTLAPTTSCELYDGGLKGLNNLDVVISQWIRMPQHSSGWN